MTWTKISRLVFRSLLGAASLPIVQLSAQAIVINNNAGIDTARSLGGAFTAVTELFVGGELCNGTLINSSYVLTAQHCTFGLAPTDISVRFRDSNPLNTLIDEFSVTSIFEADMTNNLLDGTDIAILELSSPAPKFIKPLRFLTNTDNLVGSTITTVGFGLNGIGSEGHQFTRDDQRWAAENILDWIGGAPFPNGRIIPNSFNIFSTDFDDGTAISNTLFDFGSSASPFVNEGTTALGDSGGPLLIKKDKEFLIAGVFSGGTTATSIFSDISWWTGSEKHRLFIEQKGGQFVSTSEASSQFALMTLGTVAVSIVCCGRRQRDKV